MARSGACTVKLFTVVINSISQWDNVFATVQGILKGEVSLYRWPPVYRFELVCFANKNKNCQLSYSWFQTCQTGGQWYSDTTTFSISIPCTVNHFHLSLIFEVKAYLIGLRYKDRGKVYTWLGAFSWSPLRELHLGRLRPSLQILD